MESLVAVSLCTSSRAEPPTDPPACLACKWYLIAQLLGLQDTLPLLQLSLLTCECVWPTCPLTLCRCPGAVTDRSLLPLAAALKQVTRLSLSEARLSAHALVCALQMLPVLADLDLTACSGEGLTDGSLEQHIGPELPVNGHVHAATAATIQMPQGGNCRTGSPFKRRAAGAM